MMTSTVVRSGKIEERGIQFFHITKSCFLWERTTFPKILSNFFKFKFLNQKCPYWNMNTWVLQWNVHNPVTDTLRTLCYCELHVVSIRPSSESWFPVHQELGFFQFSSLLLLFTEFPRIVRNFNFWITVTQHMDIWHNDTWERRLDSNSLGYYYYFTAHIYRFLDSQS